MVSSEDPQTAIILPTNMYVKPIFKQYLYSINVKSFFHFCCFVHTGCKNHENELVLKGYYKTVFNVLDLDKYYYLITETYFCPQCEKETHGWQQDLLHSLEDGISGSGKDLTLSCRDNMPALIK